MAIFVMPVGDYLSCLINGFKARYGPLWLIMASTASYTLLWSVCLAGKVRDWIH